MVVVEPGDSGVGLETTVEVNGEGKLLVAGESNVGWERMGDVRGNCGRNKNIER